MRILLDECVDWRPLRELKGYDAKTVRQMGWGRIANGELLRVAEEEFDAFITTDKNLSFQQNVPRFEIAVFVLSGRSDRLIHLRELVPALLRELSRAQAGEVVTISERDTA